MKKSKIKNFAFYFVILYFALYIFPLTKVYGEEINLSIEPATLQIRANPPADIRAPFTIENQSDQAIKLTTSLKGLEMLSDQTFNFLDSDATTSAQDILTYAEILDMTTPVSTVTLAPKQKKELIFHIAVPKKTSLSDHIFALTFLTEQPTSLETESTISFIQGGIALPVLLALEEKREINASIAEFSTPFLRSSGIVPFTLRITNHGDHFITPRGEIFIKNIFAQTVGKIALAPTTILSKTTDEIPEIAWQEKFPIGLYKAELRLLLSESGPLYQRNIYFFAFPAKFFLWVVFGIFIILFLFSRIRRQLVKK